MNELIERQVAYEEGREAGIQFVFDEIEDILDRCAHDNGAMIVRALRELKEKYKTK